MKIIKIFGVFPGIPLSSNVIEEINSSDVIFSGHRNLELLNINSKNVIFIEKFENFIKNFESAFKEGKKISVIASGDPLFFGIGSYITANYPKDSIEIHPCISSAQVAMSRVDMDYKDIKFISLHGRDLKGTAQIVRNSAKIMFFTDGKNTPGAIGKYLLDFNIDNYYAYVFENLGYKNERIKQIDIKNLQNEEFSDLNLLLLVRKCKKQYSLEDKFFEKENNNITKLEIREISISDLDVENGNILWDIGSGSGAVSISATFKNPGIKVFAIERESERCNNIEKNIKKFSADINIIKGVAPEILDSLPDPDRIFIGGSGGSMDKIIKTSISRIKEGGIIIINIATLESLSTAIETLENMNLKFNVKHVSISISGKAGKYNVMKPLDPVYIIKVKK